MATLQSMADFSVADATAALQHCDNDPSSAKAYIEDCKDKGVDVAARVATPESKAIRPTVDALRLAQGQEAEAIMSMITREGRVKRSDVLKIERVQNLRLWTKYLLRREEVVEAAGFAQERFFFHGSAPGVLEAIKKDGVDCRFAKESGLLGTGTYFAELISLALCYVTRGVPQGAEVPAAAAAVANTDECTRLLLCRVTLGRDLPGDSSLRRPPMGGDSANGVTGGFNMWTVYDNAQAFPEYIITLKKMVT